MKRQALNLFAAALLSASLGGCTVYQVQGQAHWARPAPVYRPGPVVVERHVVVIERRKLETMRWSGPDYSHHPHRHWQN
jgi:hypothetical protein